MSDWRAILAEVLSPRDIFRAIKGFFVKVEAINNSPCDTCGQRLGDNPDNCTECHDYELERRAY